MAKRPIKRSSNKQIAFVIILLLLFYPLGLMLLLFWIKWGRFEKFITALSTLGLLVLVAIQMGVIYLIRSGLNAALKQNVVISCTPKCFGAINRDQCIDECVEEKVGQHFQLSK